MIPTDRELVFDDTVFVFEMVMRVRNNEIGVGNFLTPESLSHLLSETRERFLYAKGIQQIHADYQGLIIVDMQLNLFSMVRTREALLFEVGVQQLSTEGCDINIKVTRMDDGSLVAKSRQHFVNYDYRSGKVTTLNKTIKQALDQCKQANA